MTAGVVYEPGDTFLLGGEDYLVVGVGLGRLCARNTATGEEQFFTGMDLLPTMQAHGATGPPTQFDPLDPRVGLLTVTDRDRPTAQFWLNHLLEITSGVHPDYPERRREQYRASAPKTARVEAKAAELSAVCWPDGRRHQVSPRTVFRQLQRLRDGGPAALVATHQRVHRAGGNQSEDLIRVLDEVLAGYQVLSDVPYTTLAQRVRLAFEDAYPDLDLTDPCAQNYFAWPSYTTMYRLIRRRGAHLLVGKRAVRRRSAAMTPDAVHLPTLPARPGAEVIADTTCLDVLCVNESGTATRPFLTVMIDKMTRSITGWIITVETPNATDLAIMLAESLVPFPLRDGAGARYSLAESRLPDRQLIALDERLAAARALPSIPPERLVIDNGSAFRSAVFDGITAAFGISVTWCNPFSPWEKGVVERAFHTINTLFASYFESYVGSDVTRRGEFGIRQITTPIDVVRELFEQWVLIVYQNRPHFALCDPTTPKRKLSPNQVATAALAYAPRFPVPVTDRMLYRAYPIRWQKILHYGVQVDGFRYDTDEFDDYRNRPSGLADHDERYEIRYNPHQRAVVWLHRPDADEWITAHVTRYRELDSPFAEEHYRVTAAEHPPAVDDTATHQVQYDSASQSRLLSRQAARRSAATADRARRLADTHTPQPSTDPPARQVDPGERPQRPHSTPTSEPITASKPWDSGTNHSPWDV